jgi:hypothetical protein
MIATASSAPAAPTHRNLVLGLILGGLVVGMVVAWMLIFTNTGLPKDPALWKRLNAGQPATTSAP